MTSPLTISTDNSAAVSALQERIRNQKAIMADPSDPGYQGQVRALAALEDQLAAMIDPGKTTGNNLVAPPPAAPTFAGARIDVGRTGVDALKLISYPGIA